MSSKTRLIIMSTLVLTTVACTNSQWMLSVIYDQMDNVLARETKEYADFTREQSDQIDFLAREYQLWHRTQHLPQYAALLFEIDQQLNSEPGINREHVAGWSAKIEGYAREMADCYPLNSAFDLMRSLTDEQVEQILAHGIEEYEEFLEDHIDFTREERLDKRYKQTIKWFGRFELNLDTDQKQQLRQAIASEQILNGGGMELWKGWHLDFVELLHRRNEPNFEGSAQAHLRKLWTLQDDNFPEVVQSNRELWIDYFYELSKTLNQSQKQDFSAWLRKMEANLVGISESLSENEQELLAEASSACLMPQNVISQRSLP